MPISIPDLFGIPYIFSIDMAPNGKTMLYSSNATGIPHLYVSATKPRSKPRQITSGNNPVMIASLSPTGDRVAYLQDKDGNEQHDIFMVPARGGNPRQITRDPNRTWDVKWHPKGKEIARTYSAKDIGRLEICNLETEESFVLKEQKTSFYIAGYSHDGKWIACTERGGGKDPRNVQVIVINRSDPSDVINYKVKEGSRDGNPSWSRDDKKLAFLSDAKGRNRVVIQDFKGTERSFLPLKEGEEATDMQSPYWGPKSDKVYYAVAMQGRTRLYEHPLNKEKTALPFPEGTTTLYRVSEDGRIIIALHSAFSSPSTIYLSETGAKTVEPLTSQKYKVNLAKLAKPKSVWYKSSDGLRIHSWYFPGSYGKAPYPAVVWPHGGPWWQTYDEWDPYLQSISQSGFAVLAPNFRGSTGYGAEFRHMDLSDPGGGDLEDVVSGAKWLAKQSKIDKSRIAIMGGSYGGYMTLMALTRKPEVFAAGVAIAPIADFQESYELADIGFRKFLEELFEGIPEQKGKLYRDRSPITHVSHIKAPVLISCGRNDPRCPVQPVEKFVKKLKEMGHPHAFRIEEKEGHGALRVDALVRELTTATKYLKETMKVK